MEAVHYGEFFELKNKIEKILQKKI
jgi:hypothetical protein